MVDHTGMAATVNATLRMIRSRARWIVEGRAGGAAVIQSFLWRVFILGLNLLNGIIVVRSLGPLGRGQQAMMGLWPQILPAILTFGLPYSIVYFARSQKERRRELYGTALVWALVFGVAAAAIGYAEIPHWLFRFDAQTIGQAQALMIFAPPALVSYVLMSILDAEHEFGLSNALRNIPTVITTVILIFIVGTHRAAPLAFALAYLFPTVLAVVFIGARAAARYRPQWGATKAASRELLGYGIRVHGTTLVGTFSQQIDQILVVGLLHPVDLGVYTVALNASRVLGIFPASLLNILLAKIVGRPDDEIFELVTRIARLTMLTTGAGALALIALMPLLMPRIYGQDLLPGVAVAQILSFEVVFSSINWVLMQCYLAFNRPGIVTFLQLTGLSIAVPLMLVFIPKIGLRGAAAALLASSITRLMLGLAGYRYILKLPIPDLVPRKSDVQFLLHSIRRKMS